MHSPDVIHREEKKIHSVHYYQQINNVSFVIIFWDTTSREQISLPADAFHVLQLMYPIIFFPSESIILQQINEQTNRVLRGCERLF